MTLRKKLIVFMDGISHSYALIGVDATAECKLQVSLLWILINSKPSWKWRACAASPAPRKNVFARSPLFLPRSARLKKKWERSYWIAREEKCRLPLPASCFRNMRKRRWKPARPCSWPSPKLSECRAAKLSSGANEGTCLHILPEVFAEFKKQYPDVAVNIKRSHYGKILDSIIDNSVDFGVISLPVNDPRLTVVLIHRDELVIIAPPQTSSGEK